jgi:hypothetical protein
VTYQYVPPKTSSRVTITPRRNPRMFLLEPQSVGKLVASRLNYSQIVKR